MKIMQKFWKKIVTLQGNTQKIISTDLIFIQNTLYSKTCLQQSAGDDQFWFVINLT